MTQMRFEVAVDHALGQAMGEDSSVVTWGEDVQILRRTLLTRFGPQRVIDTPISEQAFMYAGIGAAMNGLRPVVELYMIDFGAVGWSAITNAGSKFTDFSAGQWPIPMVLRAGVGGWYSDGGQHEQALWGSLACYPSIEVVVPSTPADAAGLMLSAVRSDQMTVFLTPKLLDQQILDYLAGAQRSTVDFSHLQPADGIRGDVPATVSAIPFGQAAIRREGGDVTLISVGVGVHRCLDAAADLAAEGIEASVVDLRTLNPLDVDTIVEQVGRTGRVVVADEDYTHYGLTGEVAARLLEAGQAPKFARVAVEGTIPFAPHLEYASLPNPGRIAAAAKSLF